MLARSCPACGDALSQSLTVFPVARGRAGIVDGRHCINEISIDVVLGCGSCCETIAVVGAEELLNTLLADEILDAAQEVLGDG